MLSMRSNRFRSSGFVLALALVLAALPRVGLAQEEPKYGFVNISQVITQSDEGVAQAEDLQSMGAERERELNERRQEIAGLARQYDESVEAGTPDAELRERIEDMQRELERDLRQAQDDVDTSRKDRIQAIGDKVVQVVHRFGEENGYTAIFRIDAGEVVYVDPAADLTDQVIAAYNEAHPVE